MTDKATLPPTPPGALEERGGYQGTHDPGQPSALIQPQTKPLDQSEGPYIPVALGPASGQNSTLAASHSTAPSET
jgi:hypothetical protein